jgi:Holliday junction resolvasome RuvABC endonuclease subunit
MDKRQLKRILAIDPGSVTGWALRSELGDVASGSFAVVTPDDTIGKRWSELLEFMASASPDVLVYERSAFQQRTSVASLAAGGYIAMLELFAYRRALRLIDVHPSTLKKWATGKGAAKKPEMVRAAQRRWPDQTVENHNQADALLVLAWAVRGSGGRPEPEEKRGTLL